MREPAVWNGSRRFLIVHMSVCMLCGCARSLTEFQQVGEKKKTIFFSFRTSNTIYKIMYVVHNENLFKTATTCHTHWINHMEKHNHRQLFWRFRFIALKIKIEISKQNEEKKWIKRIHADADSARINKTSELHSCIHITTEI